MLEHPATGPIDVDISIGAGLVEIATTSADRATVEVTPYDDSAASRGAVEQTRVELTGESLVVHGPDTGGVWLFRRPPRLRIRADVPPGSRVHLRTASADLRADGTFGATRVDTASGDAYLREVGDLRLNTASGGVRVERIAGDATVRSASGDVAVTACLGTVSAATASGDIHVGEAEGQVRAKTASGRVRVGAAGGGSVEVDTASGDVSVGVRPGTRVWLDLNSLSGRTRSDLAESDEQQGQVALNVRLRSLSGDLLVTRATPTPAA
jgi:hypothetical protein